MPDLEQYKHIHELVHSADHIVVLQADNPDVDSLGSALALEHIFGDIGKKVTLYCSIDTPSYLRYLSGWDRVQKDFPNTYDLAILVDASAAALVSDLKNVPFRGVLASKPFIILDHHEFVSDSIDFASQSIVDASVSSTSELVYSLAKTLKWPVSSDAALYITAGILGDTQGLTNELATPDTYRVIAELIECGVNRAKLEESRREFNKMPENIFRYKAELITRTEFYDDTTIAVLSIPQAEINTYSPLYNPSALIQFDTLQTVGVLISIVFKLYDSGRVTAAIRSNSAAPIANKLAEHFGGGGHAYASGFKIENGRPFNEIKSECIEKTTELLST